MRLIGFRLGGFGLGSFAADALEFMEGFVERALKAVFVARQVGEE